MKRTPRRLFAITAITASLLAGCAVGPDYRRPDVETPAAFKEAGDWKIAEPADGKAAGHWWEIYADPQLNALVQQVEVSNQNVRQAEAQYRQALALLDSARAGYFPTLSATASASRGATAGPPAAIVKSDRVALNASWEADLWGGIRRGVEAGRAGAEAGAADLGAATLSAQATLVQSYLQLRIVDAQRRLLEESVVGYRRSLDITRNRYAAGVAARLDVAQADTQLKSTQAQALDLGVQRAQLEHAIAILVGKAPAAFSLPVADGFPAVPEIPSALPSALLERRADVAAAERRAAAANADIGVAQAAYFPSLTLGASGGYQGSSFSQLMTLPNRFWSVGPALALTLFDGGARSAQKAHAVAAYDANVAAYRQTVLGGFQEVEDKLAELRILAEEAVIQHEATKAAEESRLLTNNQYQAGTVSYLNVVIAEATALGAERSDLALAGSRLVASATLLKALGGDWRAPESGGR
jgi:NodT family efflux transporter outer membrane factor (OMF) lipoprotein